MPLLTNVPIPLETPVVRQKDTKRYAPDQKDPLEYTATPQWRDYWGNQKDVAQASVVRLNAVSLTNQSASIAATDFSGSALAAGVYEIRYYAAITTADGVSSSLTVTFDWTDRSVSKTVSGAAITGNTTATMQTGPAHTIRIDSASPVRYSTTYVSNTPGQMRYAIELVLAKVNA